MDIDRRMTMLGRGAYACVVRVSTTRVWKVFKTNADMKAEWATQRSVQAVDPEGAFTPRMFKRGKLSVRAFPVLQDADPEIARADTLHFIEFEYGGKVLDECVDLCGSHTLPQLLGLMRPLFQGLATLSSADPPLVHFDIKSDNLVYTEDKGIRFIDFGFSDQYEAFLMGGTTYPYHPPECAMATFLLARNNRRLPARTYHAALLSARKHLDRIRDDVDWFAAASKVLGYTSTTRLLQAFSAPVDKLQTLYGLTPASFSTAALCKTFRALVGLFVTQTKFTEASAGVLEDAGLRQGTDVYGLGIQLALMFWEKHRAEKELRGNAATKAMYHKVLQLAHRMMSVDITQRPGPEEALKQFRALQKRYSTGHTDAGSTSFQRLVALQVQAASAVSEAAGPDSDPDRSSSPSPSTTTPHDDDDDHDHTPADADTDTDADAGVEAETDTDTDTDADVGVEAETDTDTDTDADAGVEAETDAEAETDVDGGTDTDTAEAARCWDPPLKFWYCLNPGDPARMSHPGAAPPREPCADAHPTATVPEV
jgi:serine/threonine protein kinase